MFNIQFSKFKQVYALAFLPRLFLKESRYVTNKINNHCPVELLHSVKNSSDSKTRNENSTQTYDQDENILSKTEIVTVKDDLSNKNIIFPELYQIPRCTKCEYVISKLFGTKSNGTENIDSKNVNGQTAKVHAITGTKEEEKLIQKVESVNETPHVEAHPPEVEEPKTLGQSIYNIKPSEKKMVDQEVILDELAKRCLDCSIGDIDKTLVKELKNISVSNLIPNDMIRKDTTDETKRTIEDEPVEEPLNLRPTVNYFYEPLLKTNFEERDYIHRKFMPDHISNILSTQQLLTNSDQSSGGWRSGRISEKDDLHNSAISGTFEQIQSRKRRHSSLESPKNTAISANQNPGEYYDWGMPVRFSPTEAYKNTPRVIVENTISQNVVLTEHLGLGISKESTKVKEGVTDCKTYEKATINMEELANPEEFSDSKNNIPLSILLKRIQEQSKLEYCRHIVAKAEAEVVTGNKSNCPPPPDKKPARAKPCKPRCKPETTKNPCPRPCPEKKDPCAKFSPLFLTMVFKSNVPCDLSIPLQYDNITPNNASKFNPSIDVLAKDIIERFKKFGNIPNIWDLHVSTSLNPDTVLDPQT